MMQALRTAFFHLLAVMLIFFTGLALGLFLSAAPRQDAVTKGNEIRTKKISGADIVQDTFTMKSDSFSFTTHAEGKGEAVTTIPKTAVPEACDFMLRTNTVSAGVGYFFSGPYSEPFVNVGYFKRQSNFSFGGGLLFSQHTAGAYGSVMYGF
jgi:hypothetical protein